MALLNVNNKKKSGLLKPEEKMGLDETGSSRSPSSRVGAMVEGTPLGTPKAPVAEVDQKTTGTEDLADPKKKMKVKKKEIGVGTYQT